MTCSSFNSIQGEALYRFLLSRAKSSPTLRVSIRGTHTLAELEDQENRYTTVTDFDFCIDINGSVTPVQWSVADDEPAYRGHMEREFGRLTGTRRQVATAGELKLHEEWEEYRKDLGLPPWASRADNSLTDGSNADLEDLRFSKTLRQWVDEYCASPIKNKEFVYTKVLFHIFFPILCF